MFVGLCNTYCCLSGLVFLASPCGCWTFRFQWTYKPQKHCELLKWVIPCPLDVRSSYHQDWSKTRERFLKRMQTSTNEPTRHLTNCLLFLNTNLRSSWLPRDTCPEIRPWRNILHDRGSWPCWEASEHHCSCRSRKPWRDLVFLFGY